MGRGIEMTRQEAAYRIRGRGEKQGQTALSTRRQSARCFRGELSAPWDRVVSPCFSRIAG
jgi:hypothetical protein